MIGPDMRRRGASSFIRVGGAAGRTIARLAIARLAIARLAVVVGVALLQTAWPSLAAAQTPSFDAPVRCRIGSECFVQNYVDLDPGPGARDFACGTLTYDGHRGTDFRLPNLEAMRRGITVTAAAAGVVTRVRDGEEDVSIRQSGGAAAGREAGNAVVIDHGGGWETQYSHLRQGSLRVKPGDRLGAGAPLGEVGLSGNTEFPHLDFSVRHDGRVVDPYIGETEAQTCGAMGPFGLWSKSARAALTYRASGLLGAGFAAETPQAAKARDGVYGGAELPSSVDALGVWAEFFGGRAGDRLILRLTGPDGRGLRESNSVVPRPLAALFVATTVPRPETGWPPGVYRLQVTLQHGGDTVVKEERRLQMR